MRFRISNITRLELKESVTTLHSSLRPERRPQQRRVPKSRPNSSQRQTDRGTDADSADGFAARRFILRSTDRTAASTAATGKVSAGSGAVFIAARGDDEDRGRDEERDTERSANGPPRKPRSAGREGGREGGRSRDVDCIDTDRIKRNKIAARNANAREELPLVIHSLAAWRTTGCALSHSANAAEELDKIRGASSIHRSID